MPSQFERAYVLKISSPTKILTDPSQPYNLSLADAWTDTPASTKGNLTNALNVVEITDLRIKATINSTVSNSNTNYSEIIIYNAPTALKEQLKENDSYIQLAAGYRRNIFDGTVYTNDDLPTLFMGDIVESATKKVGADYITTIKSKDSIVMKRDAYVSSYYLGGVLIKDILKDLIQNYMPKVSVGRIDIDLLPIVSKLNFPYLAYGKVSDVLDELAKDFGFIWYITGNKFYATLPTIGRAKDIVYIDPSDVIGDVQPANSSNNSKDPTKTKSGLKIRVFLDGRLDTSKYVNISGYTDQSKNGDFKIIDLRHELDNRGQNWYTELTVEGV